MNPESQKWKMAIDLLPSLPKNSESETQTLLNNFNLPRTVLASKDEITACWTQLSKHLINIPPKYRTEPSLFDAGINYIWNLGMICLRDKVKQFGYKAIKQILEKDLDDTKLSEMQDSMLLETCLKLNLISEEGFSVIEYCRDVRNNLSTAHPSLGLIDDAELIVFVSRCSKYIFNTEALVGVDTKSFIQSVKGDRFTNDQLDEWLRRINETHEAQRSSIIATLHGIYCDPTQGQESRLNAIDLCDGLYIDSMVARELSDRHADYMTKGDESRLKASREFFEKLSILNLLKTEIRNILKNNIGDNIFGVKIEISKDVPPNEIWFVDAEGQKHVIENVKFEHTQEGSSF